jgi:threonine dehydrogenase-like Zn-dependent dehydrogenase
VIGIDSVPARLAFAQQKSGIEVIDFKEYKDVVKRMYELVPRGLDVAIDCGTPFLSWWYRTTCVLDRNIPRAQKPYS